MNIELRFDHTCICTRTNTHWTIAGIETTGTTIETVWNGRITWIKNCFTESNY